jgi:MFS family permease
MNESNLTPNPIVPASIWKQLGAREWRHLLSAMQHPDFRFFLAGSFLSNIGTWMQSVAQAWLVLQLTNSPFYLGLDGFATTLPIAVFALGGGVIADRFDRRKMLIGTQWIQLTLALALGILTQLHRVTVWQVIFISFLTGLTQSIAWPVYQAVLANIVQRENLGNAIALNSTQFNLARMIGPVLGALALSSAGMAGCFYANALSFIAVLYALWRMHAPTNRRGPQETSVWESIQEGLGYLAGQPILKWLLIMMAVTTLLGIPLMTLLPVFARDVLRAGATGYGILVAAFGAGAVAAGVLVALLGDFRGKGLFVLRSVGAFVVTMLVFAVSRNMLLSALCLFIAGFSMVCYTSVINTTIQSAVPDHLRGRAMSLFVFSFGGCMPVGNLVSGFLAKSYGAPKALILQGVLLAGFVVYLICFQPEIRTS